MNRMHEVFTPYFVIGSRDDLIKSKTALALGDRAANPGLTESPSWETASRGVRTLVICIASPGDSACTVDSLPETVEQFDAG